MKDIYNTQSIKYMGSKNKLLPYIFNEVNSLNLDLKNTSILDGFGGSTRVGQMFSKMEMKVTSNDITDYSYVLGNCYLKNHNLFEITEIINYLNSLQSKKGWFYENYSILDKQPFQNKNLMKLDSIRDEIDNLNLNESNKSVILTSLMLGLDKVDNTLGHFTSYLKNFSKRSYNDLKLELPNLFYNKNDNIMNKGNILDLIKNNEYDIVYLDPPYGTSSKMKSSRVRYNAYYHLWNTIVKNDKPVIFGKAGRRDDSRDKFVSDFEITNNNILKNNFIDLLNNIKARYIILSYNSAGSISINEFKEIVEKIGKITIKEIDYKTNVMSKMNWSNEFINDNQNKYKEYLITIRK